jgi:hypothetical protein
MITLSEIPTERRVGIVARIIEMLEHSAFKTPQCYPLAMVVLRAKGEPSYVTSRGCFASWLQNNDLPSEAREVRNRKLRPGQTLVWLDVDTSTSGGVAVCGILVVDVVREAKALIAAGAARRSD